MKNVLEASATLVETLLGLPEDRLTMLYLQGCLEAWGEGENKRYSTENVL